MRSHRAAAPALGALLLLGGTVPGAAQYPTEPHTLEPARSYVARRTSEPIAIDGRIDERAWDAAPWSDDFVDIEGSARPRPPLRTRVRLLWDERHLYIAAALDEPHVWGTLTERDAVIFQDDDFEVFIDPDGDTHEYYELEVNALGTVWDLMLTKPYRDDGRALDAWDIRALRIGVQVRGTLNDPSDEDQGWNVELAIPWDVLAEAAPEGRAPRAGEQWRINFSRVDWDVTPRAGRYEKELDPATGKPRAEHNWVWSPQGAVNMHMPERWGVVQFAEGTGAVTVNADPDAAARAALRALYYAQRRYHEQHGRYAATLAELAPEPALLAARPRLDVTPSGWEITAPRAAGGTLHIRADGRQWQSGAR